MSIGAIVLVVAMGWHFGLKIGVYTALASIPINLCMASLLGLDWYILLTKMKLLENDNSLII